MTAVLIHLRYGSPPAPDTPRFNLLASTEVEQPVASPEAGVIRNYLDLLCAMPWATSGGGEVSLEKAREVLEKDHYGLEKIKKLDFYGGALATAAAARLKVCEDLLEAYAQRVFDAHDENR